MISNELSQARKLLVASAKAKYERNIIYRKTEKGRFSQRRSQCKKLYGITMDRSLEMMKEQNNLCACCKTKLGSFGLSRKDRKSNTPCIDHDHTTNKVRGIVCINCNILLGYVKDSVKRLIQASIYLQKQKINLM